MMMRYMIWLVSVFLAGCGGTSSLSLGEDYRNVLNITNWPQQIREGVSLFSDLGAWHGFAFIPDSVEMVGGFAGPMSMYSNYVIGSYTGRMFVEVDGNMRGLEGAEVRKDYFPGRMVQTIKWTDLTLVQEVVFVNNRASLMRSRIRNTGKRCQVRVSYEGDFMANYFQGKVEEGRVVLTFPAVKVCCEIEGGDDFAVEVKRGRYRFEGKTPQVLGIGEEREDVFVYRAYFTDEADSVKYPMMASDPFVDSDSFFRSAERRWDGYIKKLFVHESPLFDTLTYRRLAVKCMMTLMANWRSAAQDLLHDGGYPSYWGFSSGFWSWDSWKIAAALCRWEPELAKDHVRALFDYQAKEGMIPDFVSPIRYINNLRDTKPPLASWAVEEIFKTDGDLKFVSEMFEQLLKYHRWWYVYRDVDVDGVCEYGSSDGTLEAAAWESGMDNAVRFDSVVMMKGEEEKAWSMNQESVDLNAYLYREKITLAHFARLLEKEEIARKLEREADVLRESICALMYDEEKGYFFDSSLNGESKIRIYGPEGWLPLWADVAQVWQAEKVKEVMMDARHFNSYIPLGTLSVSHPELEPEWGYWRGPVWLDQAYFGIRGLRNYGYEKEADDMTLKILRHCRGLLEDAPVHENYNPLTGEPLNAPHFGWSAAHVLLMLLEYAG